MKLKDIGCELRCKWWDYCYIRDNKKYLKKYSDYKIDEFNDGALKFIWGVKSWDDLSGADACLYTMNDIDIVYNRDTKQYNLGIETAYCFGSKEEECKYLRQLLGALTKFMDDHGYDKNVDYSLWFANPVIDNKSESIEKLYIDFKIFVKGYCKTYGYIEC